MIGRAAGGALAIAATVAAVGGCGGSARIARSGAQTAHATHGSAGGGTGPGPAAARPRTGRPPAVTATVLAGHPSTVPPSAHAGASEVRLPARFLIEAGGRLAPPTVAAPAGVAIELTVVSADGRAHRVMVAGRALAIPAGGRALTALGGLGRGSYAVVVDGARRGALIVGVQPGP